MKKYQILLSEEADNDINSVVDFIISEYHAPLTAKRYYDGLFATIRSLTTNAESYPISNRHEFQKYGFNVRRVNYKKMTILYTIHADIIYIHRIKAQSLIIGK